MVGIPKYCQTKKDWQNAVDFAIAQNKGKTELYSRLEQLRDNHYMNVLKKSSKDKPVEEQTPEDYEPVDNPAAEKYRLGFTDEEINRYLETGDYVDKAGAYGIQNAASVFVKEISGDYYSIVGFPIGAVNQALKTFN